MSIQLRDYMALRDDISQNTTDICTLERQVGEHEEKLDDLGPLQDEMTEVKATTDDLATKLDEAESRIEDLEDRLEDALEELKYARQGADAVRALMGSLSIWTQNQETPKAAELDTMLTVIVQAEELEGFFKQPLGKFQEPLRKKKKTSEVR